MTKNQAERDAGNEVRILTGNHKNSTLFWRQLSELCEGTVFSLQDMEPKKSAPTKTPPKDISTKKPLLFGDAVKELKPAGTLKQLLKYFDYLIALPDYISKKPVKFDQDSGKPNKFKDVANFRTSIGIDVDGGTSGVIPVTDELRKQIQDQLLKSGTDVYKLGGNLYRFSAWHDSRENYSGIDIVRLNVTEL